MTLRCEPEVWDRYNRSCMKVLYIAAECKPFAKVGGSEMSPGNFPPHSGRKELTSRSQLRSMSTAWPRRLRANCGFRIVSQTCRPPKSSFQTAGRCTLSTQGRVG
jgi:hypothetical protein